MRKQPIDRVTLTRRRTWALGLLLVLVFWRWVLLPYVMRIPSHREFGTTLVGQVELLSSIEISQEDFPLSAVIDVQTYGTNQNQLKVVQRVHFNTLVTEQNLVLRKALELFLKQAAWKNDKWEKISLLLGTSSEVRTFWVDARKATYLAPEEARGYQWTFPVGAKGGKSYQFWDETTQIPVTYTEVSQERVSLTNVRTYRAPLAFYDIGSFDLPGVPGRVRLDALGEILITVEKNSSLPLRTEVNLALRAQSGLVGLDVLTLKLATEEEQYKDSLRDGFWLGAGIRLAKTYVPFTLLVVAVYVLMGFKFPKSAKRRAGSRRF